MGPVGDFLEDEHFSTLRHDPPREISCASQPREFFKACLVDNLTDGWEGTLAMHQRNCSPLLRKKVAPFFFPLEKMDEMTILKMYIFLIELVMGSFSNGHPCLPNPRPRGICCWWLFRCRKSGGRTEWF